MTVSAFVYAEQWPFQRTGWLRNATAITYSMEVMEPGKFQFELPANNALSITAGALVGFKSSYGLPDFLGWVDRVEESYGGAFVTVSGREWSAILNERTTVQDRTYVAGVAGIIAADIVRSASARNPTGIMVMPSGGSTPITSPFSLRADAVLSALNDLAQLTGDEYEIVYQAGVSATASFFWRGKIGFDMRDTLHLAGKMIAGADYALDAINDRALVQVVGSSGDFGSRPSAAAIDTGPLALQDTSLIRTSLPADASKRQVQRRGIATSREAVIRDTSLPDGLSVQRGAVETLRALIAGQETISVLVSPYADWSLLSPGNLITVRLPNLRFGEHVVRAFRILGIQPREERGVMELVGKVVANA